MAYDEDLASRIRVHLAPRDDVGERNMFGGIAFMVADHMACGVIDTMLMLRLTNEQAAEALGQPHTRPMDFTGRPMKNFIYVDPPGLAADADLARWVDLAVAHAAALPPKPPKKARKRKA